MEMFLHLIGNLLSSDKEYGCSITVHMYLQAKERKLSNNEKAFSLIVCELNDKSDRFMAI